MGLIDPPWPLSPREVVSPAWKTLSAEAKDRFDYQMAVYAATVEAIDVSIGTLVKGLEARGVLDNTMIVFMSAGGALTSTKPSTAGDAAWLA